MGKRKSSGVGVAPKPEDARDGAVQQAAVPARPAWHKPASYGLAFVFATALGYPRFSDVAAAYAFAIGEDDKIMPSYHRRKDR
jgi:hypothetical protein